MIANGCDYCGNHSIRMTMDRIDNSKGHTITNVVPACYRCNMIRGNMPYEAWLNMVPALKDTIEKGLLDGWLGFGPWAGLKNNDVGGEAGVRTQETDKGLSVFRTGAISHSATSPN